MNYQIITDSCCDFTDEQYRSMDVTCVPLTVMWDNSPHTHFSSEPALKDFYDRMRSGLVATTSALNPDNWERAMVPFLNAGKDLLVVTVSSGISATYQSAVIAAEDAAMLAAILRESYGVRNVLTGYVGPVLGAHAGPGVLGLFHLGKRR